MTPQLLMFGWLGSQAPNKLQQSRHQHFHYFAVIVVYIITASPILISPLTTDQMLMVRTTVCWLTIISLASTVKNYSRGWDRKARRVSVYTVTFLHNYWAKLCWETALTHKEMQRCESTHVHIHLNMLLISSLASLSHILLEVTCLALYWNVTPCRKSAKKTGLWF